MPREQPGRGARRWIAVGCAALLVLAPLAVWLLAFAPRSARRARLEARLEEGLRAYRAQRWERPVLRGEPIEGNALEAQLEAMGGFRGLETAGFEGLGALLASGGEPPPELRGLASENAEAIARYRASTQRTFAWGDAHPEAGLAGPSPDWLPHVRAGRVVLLSALGRSPRECLEIAADVLRLGQDRAAGTGLVPLMILAAHAEDVLALAGRCLREADGEALASAARELALLARHPAPTGTAMESEALFLGVALRDEERLSPSLPTDSLGWERWVRSWERLEAWDLLMGEPASLRAIGADYPDDIDRVERRQRDLADRDNDVIAIGMPDYARFLRRDAATRAIVRLLLAAARLRLAHDAPPDAAPALLSDPELVDPTTGRPFAWTREEDGGTLASRSTGALARGELAVRLTWAPESSVPDLLAEEAEAEGQGRDPEGEADVDDREHGP